MNSVQFNQLNDNQKADAIKKMAATAKALDFTLFESQSEAGITDAVLQDASPDAEFMFLPLNDLEVDVKYRENI
ncbi:MAG: hypothetical protein WKF97_15465 [Chitinophagaceae bacterium]